MIAFHTAEGFSVLSALCTEKFIFQASVLIVNGTKKFPQIPEKTAVFKITALKAFVKPFSSVNKFTKFCVHPRTCLSSNSFRNAGSTNIQNREEL